MNKITKSVLGVMMTAISSFSFGEVSTGSLTLIWQGRIPEAAIVSGTWKFTDGAGNDFVPTVQTLNVTDIEGGIFVNTVAPVNFEIRSNNPTTHSINDIKVYLLSRVLSAGLVTGFQLAQKTELESPNSDEVLVLVNEQTVKVGSANSITLTRTGDTQSEPVSVELHANISQARYTPGSTVTFTVPLIFAVDLIAGTEDAEFTPPVIDV